MERIVCLLVLLVTTCDVINGLPHLTLEGSLIQVRGRSADSETERVRRSADEFPTKISVDLTSADTKTHLELQQIVDITDDVPVLLWRDNKVKKYRVEETEKVAFYEDVEHGAAIMVSHNKNNNSDDEFSYFGTFLTADGERFIQPSHDQDDMYTISKVEMPNIDNIDYQISSNYDNPKKHKPSNNRPGRQKRNTISYQAEIFFVVDYAIYLNWYDKTVGESDRATATLGLIKQYYAFVLNAIDVRYQSVTGYGFSISCLYAGIFIADTASSLSFVEENKIESNSVTYIVAEVLLPNFKSWAETNVANMYNYDHAMLLTGYEMIVASGDTSIAGLAYTSRTCTSFKYSIGEDKNFQESIGTLMAHELGHNLGALHDNSSENNCFQDDGYVMAPSYGHIGDVTVDRRAYIFSTCSNFYFNDYIQELIDNSNNCLATLDANYDTSDMDPYVNDLAGQVYSPDVQCSESYGTGSYLKRNLYTNFEDICTAMYCTDPDDANFYYTTRPWEGTTCASGKLCEKGYCVQSASAPTIENESCLYGDVPTLCEQVITSNTLYNCQEYSQQCCSSCAGITDTLGQLYTPDEQCEIIVGNGSFLYRTQYDSYETICSQMYCAHPTENLYYFKNAWEGTPCGSGKLCQGGSCVVSASAAPVDNEACLFGNVPYTVPFSNPQVTCAEMITISSGYYCYQDFYYEACCSSCEVIRQTFDLPSCPFGDRQSWCAGLDEANCNVNSEQCCNNCYVPPETTTTTTTTSTSTTTPTTTSTTTTPTTTSSTTTTPTTTTTTPTTTSTTTTTPTTTSTSTTTTTPTTTSSTTTTTPTTTSTTTSTSTTTTTPTTTSSTTTTPTTTSTTTTPTTTSSTTTTTPTTTSSTTTTTPTTTSSTSTTTTPTTTSSTSTTTTPTTTSTTTTPTTTSTTTTTTPTTTSSTTTSTPTTTSSTSTTTTPTTTSSTTTTTPTTTSSTSTTTTPTTTSSTSTTTTPTTTSSTSTTTTPTTTSSTTTTTPTTTSSTTTTTPTTTSSTSTTTTPTTTSSTSNTTTPTTTSSTSTTTTPTTTSSTSTTTTPTTTSTTTTPTTTSSTSTTTTPTTTSSTTTTTPTTTSSTSTTTTPTTTSTTTTPTTTSTSTTTTTPTTTSSTTTSTPTTTSSTSTTTTPTTTSTTTTPTTTSSTTTTTPTTTSSTTTTTPTTTSTTTTTPTTERRGRRIVRTIFIFQIDLGNQDINDDLIVDIRIELIQYYTVTKGIKQCRIKNLVLRKGSLIADYDVEIEDTDQSAAELTKANLDLVKAEETITILNKTVSPSSVTVNDVTVTNETVTNDANLCQLFISTKSCSDGFECVVNDGNPSCKKIDDKFGLTLVIVAVISSVVLLFVVLGVACLVAKMCCKDEKTIYPDSDTTDTQDESKYYSGYKYPGLAVFGGVNDHRAEKSQGYISNTREIISSGSSNRNSRSHQSKDNGYEDNRYKNKGHKSKSPSRPSSKTSNQHRHAYDNPALDYDKFLSASYIEPYDRR